MGSEFNFSAYGVSLEEGGVALSNVPPSSAAAQAGLKAGDLIQGVNSKPVRNLSQLFRVLSAEKSASLQLKVVRDQVVIHLTVESVSIVEIETAS